MSLPALDAITGVLLIGTWANSFLYMAEIIQATYYFRHFKHDDWKLKMFVSVAVLIDTVSTLGDYACVYLYTITHTGDLVYLADQHWPLSLHLFTTGVIAVLVQSFLVVRYWQITRNILITLLNSFLVIVAVRQPFASLHTGSYPLSAVHSSEAHCMCCGSRDVPCIQGSREDQDSGTDLADHRSCSGPQHCRSAALAVMEGTAHFGGDTEDHLRLTVTVGFAYMLGRVYMLSMLANLNVRRSGKSSSVDSRGVSSTAGLGTLTIPIFMVTDDSGYSHLHRTVNIGPQEDMITSNHAESLGDDSRPAEIEMTASHLPKKQSVVVGNLAGKQ
ncbi:hypothetical protein MVEN_01152400 [Mycena venus]|uniref:Uncharacterized protein n=1 Tax=Mycena venus TaxID=2733690 RepID=A0A8H6Y4Z9_9AGAR|nr:hypothetical protein MVEN_01152400 [Mycena venus]